MDNTIVPSYLGVIGRGSDQSSAFIGNNTLRIGEVKQIIYPDDDKSISKKYIEYLVEVAHRSNGGLSSTLYIGCMVNYLFGGYADRAHYTLRADTKKEGERGGIGVGSKVLMSCINGMHNMAVIFGGIPDVNDKKAREEKKDDGHNLFFEFNGCQFTINKDGELQLMFRGATKVDGELTDSAVKEAEGSSLLINKEGNISFFTKDKNQYIEINHKDKKLNIQAQKEWNTTVKGTINITADKKVNIKSEGVYVGDATDKWPLFSTYRQNEGQMNSKVAAQFNALQGLLQTAGINLTVGATLNAIDGSLATGNFSAAGSSLLSAASLCSQIGSAIQTFEGSAEIYLSKKNKND